MLQCMLTLWPSHSCSQQFRPGPVSKRSLIIIIIIILGSFIALYHIPRGVSKRSVFFLQGMWSYVLKYETYSFVAPCNGLRGAVAQYAAIKPGTLGRTPSLYDKCTGFFYVRYTTHGTNGFTSHPKDEAIMVKCLAEGQKCPDRDSNPHSADQKHQSLSPVILSARPRHAHKVMLWSLSLAVIGQ